MVFDNVDDTTLASLAWPCQDPSVWLHRFLVAAFTAGAHRILRDEGLTERGPVMMVMVSDQHEVGLPARI